MEMRKSNDVYMKCPVYKNEYITMQQTRKADAEELLSCYSDEKSIPLFNSDNCHGDNFRYETLEKMKLAIDFWDFSYQERYFVRWTILWNEGRKKIGTVEMFHRHAEDEWNHTGILRIDLQSKFECREVIKSILEITSKHFYEDFLVGKILTKAIPLAVIRREVLSENAYEELNGKLMEYGDYFIREDIQSC